ncbi:SHOCT domain-containing protein [bacterium]|nr:SHOCT domain-containing protein [bacterium]
MEIFDIIWLRIDFFFSLFITVSAILILSYKFGIFISFVRNVIILFFILSIGLYFLSEYLNVGTYDQFTGHFYSEFDRFVDFWIRFGGLYKRYLYIILILIYTFILAKERINIKSPFITISLFSLMIGFFLNCYIYYEVDIIKNNILPFIFNFSFAIFILLLLLFDLKIINKSTIEEKLEKNISNVPLKTKELKISNSNLDNQAEKIPYYSKLVILMQKRKKFIGLFILLVPIFKVLVHYFFYRSSKWDYGIGERSFGWHVEVLFVSEIWIFIPVSILTFIVMWLLIGTKEIKSSNLKSDTTPKKINEEQSLNEKEISNNISKLSDDLRELNKLKDDGILTDEEFNEQKKKLLKQ